jgi:nitrogen-specific signal transduction histidine kinase
MSNHTENTIKNLRETLERMQFVLDAIDEGIVWTNETGQIAWYNHAFQSLIEPLSSELLGNDFEKIMPLTHNNNKIPRELYPHHQAVEIQKAYQNTYEYEHAGNIKFFTIYSYLMTFTAGEKYVINIINNKTNEILLAKAKEDEKTRLLRILDLMKLGKVVMDITHELNQPLSIIRNNMETCKSVSRDQLSQQNIDEIITSTINQVDIATDILDRLRTSIEEKAM